MNYVTLTLEITCVFLYGKVKKTIFRYEKTSLKVKGNFLTCSQTTCKVFTYKQNVFKTYLRSFYELGICFFFFFNYIICIKYVSISITYYDETYLLVRLY